MPCFEKHTKYQPTDDEFKCPTCGRGPEDGGLYIYESAESPDSECSLLHEEDYLECDFCKKGRISLDYEGINGKAFVNYVVKKNNLVKCPCCKGKGMIKVDQKKE